jgi:hypothetical protein
MFPPPARFFLARQGGRSLALPPAVAGLRARVALFLQRLGHESGHFEDGRRSGRQRALPRRRDALFAHARALGTSLFGQRGRTASAARLFGPHVFHALPDRRRVPRTRRRSAESGGASFAVAHCRGEGREGGCGAPGRRGRGPRPPAGRPLGPVGIRPAPLGAGREPPTGFSLISENALVGHGSAP